MGLFSGKKSDGPKEKLFGGADDKRYREIKNESNAALKDGDRKRSHRLNDRKDRLAADGDVSRSERRSWFH